MSSEIERTASGEALTGLILRTFPFHGLLGAAGDKLGAALGLSSARWKVLGAITSASRPLHVAQIARNMGLSRQSVQRVVSDLESSGLVALSDNPDHGRARLVSLTRRGETAYDRIMERQIRWSNELAEGISPRTLEAATHVIQHTTLYPDGGKFY